MSKTKSNFRKRFVQFLSRMLWHMDTPVVPTYSYIQNKHSNGSTTTKTSSSVVVKRACQKPQLKSPHQVSPANTALVHINTLSPTRTHITQRASITLTSIQEE